MLTRLHVLLPEINVYLFIFLKRCKNVNTECICKIFTDNIFNWFSTKISDLATLTPQKSSSKKLLI